MVVPPAVLTSEDRRCLLKIARDAIEKAVRGEPLPAIALEQLSQPLREPGASFVTLTIHGELRGCIGALEARQPLALDVQEHAVAAALQDYRFPPVQPEELKWIKIEISRLTKPERVDYTTPLELIQKLRPGVDGVILRDGWRRATFLPQVWEKLPAPELFLAHLCQKMGAPPDLWRRRLLEVEVYQVEEFHENGEEP